jgi:trigger factor
MQVSVESTGTLKREMKVSIPEQRIADEVKNRLNSMSGTTKLAGFRKGKVPYKVLENHYGKQIRQEVVGDMIQTSYIEALQQEKLKPAGQPKIGPLDADKGGGLSYTAVFEVMPEVKLKKIAKLKIEAPECEISEEDYQKTVESLRQQRQTLQAVDRESRNGDTVDINFEGYMDGESFEGGSAKELKLELGKNRFIEGFEEGLIGAVKGREVSLDLKFPDTYQNEELAGKPVTFKVTINEVLEPVLPELDDAFFKNFGITEGGEEAFRKEVMVQMEKEAEAARRARLRDQVMDKLYEANSLELPHAMVHEEIHRLQHQFEERMKSYGVNPDNQKDIPMDHAAFEEQAKKRVALHLIMMELIKQQDLKADPDKVRELIHKNATNYEDPDAVISWYYQDKQRLSSVEATVLEDEVIEFVCNTASLKKKAVKFDDLMNNGHTE